MDTNCPLHAALEVRMERICVNLETLVQAIEEERAERKALNAPVRLDRLEQNEARRTWGFRATWTAILALAAKVGADLIGLK